MAFPFEGHPHTHSTFQIDHVIIYLVVSFEKYKDSPNEVMLFVVTPVPPLTVPVTPSP